MKAGVVGLGLIGGSLLRALGGVGHDADPAVRAAAVSEGFEVADSPAGLAGCDLVLVAVPPARTAEVVGEVLEALPDALVADTASVKAGLPRHERLVGAHPMAGAETAGWDASTAVLLQGAPWAACPAGEALEPLLALSEAVDALGGRLVACTPEDHDAAVARTSHVPHLAAQALAGLAADGGLQAALAGTAFRDMTRVARSDAGLWTEILAANRVACLAAVDELVARLGVLRAALGDEEATRSEWALGLEWLDAVDAARWHEPEWREEPVDGWAGLLAHGREGRAVRRLRRDAGGTLHAEVAR
ncbi:MAG TPA: prephenate dehydrogenase/arogenate dehydrogenase family protein [Solirubrobacteraceae bacterium]|nr:prephenate dehydrogenase/arogenate dehydrogenase family protein [Solirubrobacteraceae bacterium]